MWTRWTRTPVPRWCCHDTLWPRGTPFLTVRVRVAPDRVLWRCPLCAGELAPADLPALEDLVRPPPALRRVVLPFDWKARQSGDRDPGEEG
jgi:hypothetical protein